MIYLAGGVLLGWLAGFVGAAIISFVIALIAKGIRKLIRFIRA